MFKSSFSGCFWMQFSHHGGQPTNSHKIQLPVTGRTPTATLGYWLMLWTETFRLTPVSVYGRHWLGWMGEDSVTAFDPTARRMEIMMKDSSEMLNSVKNCSAALLPSPLLVGPGEVGILNLPCEGLFYKEGKNGSNLSWTNIEGICFIGLLGNPDVQHLVPRLSPSLGCRAYHIA